MDTTQEPGCLLDSLAFSFNILPAPVSAQGMQAACHVELATTPPLTANVHTLLTEIGHFCLQLRKRLRNAYLQLPAHGKEPGERLKPPGAVQPQQRRHIAVIPLVWVPHTQDNLQTAGV